MTSTDVRRVAEPLLPRDGRRRRRIVLVGVLTVVLAAVLVWVVFFSSVFGARGVEVHGTRALTHSEIERAADVPHGTALVRLDTAAITRRVERLPQVESARVSTSFPSTVVISVTERTPVGYVETSGRRTLVDHTGTRYLAVTTVPEGLPALDIPAGTGAAVAAVAASLPADLRSRTTSIQALDSDAITVVLRGGLLVRWGGAERSALKARLVDVLREQRPKPGRIDVTDPDRPFTTR